MKETENIGNVFYTARVKGINGLIHVGVWCVVFLLPYMLTGNWSPKVYVRASIVLIPFMIVFYANYCELIKRYLYVRRVKPFPLSNLLLISLVLLAVHLLMPIAHKELDHPKAGIEPQWNVVLAFQFMNFMLYTMAVGLSVAIKMTIGWFKVERIQQMFEK